MDGSYAIVGASRDNSPGPLKGSASIFERSSGTGQWTKKVKLFPDPGIGVFGYAVSISGDSAIVGNHADTKKGNNAGSVYIYERTSAGNWPQLFKLYAADATAEDEYGWSVAISGNYAIVGAPEDDSPLSNAGSAYILERHAFHMWQEQQKLVASDPPTTWAGPWRSAVAKWWPGRSTTRTTTAIRLARRTSSKGWRPR